MKPRLVATATAPPPRRLAPGRLHEYRLSLNGIRTRAIEVGGSGPPVLLLHGFCDSADSWRNVLERLAQRGRAAIAYDLPGFGFAGPARHHGNLLDQQVAFSAAAIRLAAESSGEQVIVAGNSLGGWTTLRLGERDDLPIAGIIPVAPAGIALSPWFFRLDSIPGIAQLLAIPAPVPERVVRAVVARAVRLVGFGDPATVDRRFVRSFSFHNRNRRIVLERIGAAQGVRAEAKRPFDPEKVGFPAVVVWGSRDLLCQPKGAEPLAELLGAKLIMVRGCGHLPQVEAPDSVIEAIEAIGG